MSFSVVTCHMKLQLPVKYFYCKCYCIYLAHPEACSPKAYNSVAKLGFFREPHQNLLPNMELLISEIVARNLYHDVNDAVQKA